MYQFHHKIIVSYLKVSIEIAQFYDLFPILWRSTQQWGNTNSWWAIVLGLYYDFKTTPIVIFLRAWKRSTRDIKIFNKNYSFKPFIWNNFTRTFKNLHKNNYKKVLLNEFSLNENYKSWVKYCWMNDCYTKMFRRS